MQRLRVRWTWLLCLFVVLITTCGALAVAQQGQNHAVQSVTAVSSATDLLLSMGLPGVVILALGYAVLHLYRAQNATQEKRIAEQRDLLEKFHTAIQKYAEELRALNEGEKRRDDEHPN